jgi:hypothetical protein
MAGVSNGALHGRGFDGALQTKTGRSMAARVVADHVCVPKT